ncbi:AadA family aminoglycoside 3''-O-nucleotidyltransferase [Cellvibrio mixtus]|uniref:AadA family aminoglycoside 3''-O-nucleotidyltransferase n=1 Tax=Cellvibrio mixtus TaxID=39650 RepID=UPI0005865BE0|nr:AadA family aminoglycoside 3''-O-nucleotidyltransferase [Cellvibrio mixtus]
MLKHIPAEIVEQVDHALVVLDRHLGNRLQAIHLFGSALDGGLKPHSDIDLLVTVTVPLEDGVRRALMLDLLNVSVPPGSKLWRPLEVTVIAINEIIPWRYPAKRELQFGEWLREDLLRGIFEPALVDHDLAIILTKTTHNSIALRGLSAELLFPSIPEQDFIAALADTIALWNSPEDWDGDERNIVLALARIWFSASTGKIASKDVAAEWILKQLPEEHQVVVKEARDAYLGVNTDIISDYPGKLAAFIFYAKTIIGKLLRVEPYYPSGC